MVAYNRESNGQGTRAEDGPWKPQIETPAQPTGSDQWISATPRRRDEGAGVLAQSLAVPSGTRIPPPGRRQGIARWCCHGRMGFMHSGVDCSYLCNCKVNNNLVRRTHQVAHGTQWMAQPLLMTLTLPRSPQQPECRR